MPSCRPRAIGATTEGLPAVHFAEEFSPQAVRADSALASGTLALRLMRLGLLSHRHLTRPCSGVDLSGLNGDRIINPGIAPTHSYDFQGLGFSLAGKIRPAS